MSKTIQPKQKRRRRKGLGLTVRAFAAEIDTPLSLARKIVASGDVKVVKIGDQERIPMSEVERLRATFGAVA